MRRSTRVRGMTLIEIMLSLAIAAILATATLQLLSGQMGYGRRVAQQSDVIDRARVLREIISQDLINAGYYRSHEGRWFDGTENILTGTAGTAGLGSSLVNWPQYPVTGTDGGATDSDLIHLLTPTGWLVGIGASDTYPSYQCYETAGTIEGTASTSPLPDFTGWTAGSVILATGSGVSFLTELVSFTDPPSDGGIKLGPLQNTHCVEAGTAVLTTLPGLFAAVPVEGISYVIADEAGIPVLRRCVATLPASGPLAVTKASPCTASSTVMKGVEDIQFEYIFSWMTLNASSVPDGSGEYVCHVPGLLKDDDGVLTEDSINMPAGSVAACLGSFPKRKVPVDNGDPSIRFVAIDVTVVTRAMQEDTRSNNGLGRRPAAANRSAAATADSYRRSTLKWRVVLPNAFSF